MSTKAMNGFSLLEALCALTITLIITATAAPTLSSWILKQRVSSLQVDLFHITSQARYVAVTRKARITLCPLTPEGSCSARWEHSLSSFIDNNGNRRLDADEEVISTLLIPEGINLYWRGMQPINSIHFSSQGMTFVSNGTMSLCPQPPTTPAKALQINRQGRIKTADIKANCHR